MKIIYLEDNALNVVVMRHLLKDYELDIAENSSDAFALLEAKSYDLMLFDIQLGEDIDGVDVLHRVKASSKNNDTIAFAVTACISAADKERFLTNGFDDYFPKPVDTERLIYAIEKLREAITTA